MFYKLDPEVAGHLGPHTVMDTSSHPPTETNAFILLYNFRYTGAPGTEAGAQKSLPKIRYLGSIAVDMPWPD